jgi:hypothetical protein
MHEANDYAVRRVRMNEPHPAQVRPSWYGDSVGHYEGDTLVIDTIGVKAATRLARDGDSAQARHSPRPQQFPENGE